jgi:MoaA/NifB/PqqE/SkfB family radical SAM enzyme
VRLELRQAYDEHREIEHQPFRAACYAAHTSLHLDAHGRVSVCALNRLRPAGEVGQASLEEIWRGPVMVALREALRAYDLSQGCHRCRWEIEGGKLTGAYATGFDEFPADEEPAWPRRMEFALSNVCNLECVMCSGEFSSAIRARREGLPPLRHPYDDAFFDDLRPFLPHLRQARFLGGEPFLVPEYFRIWDLMIEVGATAQCNVTTNGTRFDRRVERVLEALPFSIGISIDGVRRETVESIRRGASYDELMANVARFRAYTEAAGTSLSLTYCLMVPNWQEFGDYLRFAQELGAQVYVNPVYQPSPLSLYRLDADELGPIVEALEAQTATVLADAPRNARTWTEQLARLHGRLTELTGADRRRADPADPAHRQGWQAVLDGLLTDPVDVEQACAGLARLSIDDSFATVPFDGGERVDRPGPYLGLAGGVERGEPYARVFARLCEEHGDEVEVLAERARIGLVGRVVLFRSGDAPPRVAIILGYPEGEAVVRAAGLVDAAAATS